MIIADELRAGIIVRGIATLLGRAPSTISREVRRNRGEQAAYRPFTAEQLARQRRRRQHRLKVEANAELAPGWLRGWWSTRAHHRSLAPFPAVFPRQRSRHVPHETIYRAVYRHLLPPLTRGPRSRLRTGPTYRKAHRHSSRQRARFGLPVRMISDRPAHVLERLEAGH